MLKITKERTSFCSSYMFLIINSNTKEKVKVVLENYRLTLRLASIAFFSTLARLSAS